MDPEGRNRTGISAVDSCALYQVELPRGRSRGVAPGPRARKMAERDEPGVNSCTDAAVSCILQDVMESQHPLERSAAAAGYVRHIKD